MKKQTKPIANGFVVAGTCLILIALLAVLGWSWSIHTSRQAAENYAQQIRTLIPEPQGAALEERRDNTMPLLSLEGTNFLGILEMPKYGSVLPVSGDWGKVSKYPCRFSGSVYDRTIQIGVTSQAGQYDFYREISVGDSVLFTDMEGNRFSYQITDIRYEKHADQTALTKETADLTLFIKNVFSFEYILLFCHAES